MRSAELRNHERELYEFHFRVGVAAIAVVAAFGLLAGRFVYLQLAQHEAYRAKAEDNRISIVPISPNRGLSVDIKARLFRQYPYGETASHAIGYMGRINLEDQEKLEEDGVGANYRGTDSIGKSGLEASYQDELHGVTGFERVEIDAAGRGIRTLPPRTPSQPGNNIALTLDLKLQQVGESALGERRGAMVALEPSTGAVLAFVSKPGYDPNLFVDGIDPQSWFELNNSPDKPLVNRAINGLYPPGSTFKPFMAMTALELGKRTFRSTIHSPCSFEFGGRRFRDSKVGGDGTVDLMRPRWT